MAWQLLIADKEYDNQGNITDKGVTDWRRDRNDSTKTTWATLLRSSWSCRHLHQFYFLDFFFPTFHCSWYIVLAVVDLWEALRPCDRSTILTTGACIGAINIIDRIMLTSYIVMLNSSSCHSDSQQSYHTSHLFLNLSNLFLKDQSFYQEGKLIKFEAIFVWLSTKRRENNAKETNLCNTLRFRKKY